MFFFDRLQNGETTLSIKLKRPLAAIATGPRLQGNVYYQCVRCNVIPRAPSTPMPTVLALSHADPSSTIPLDEGARKASYVQASDLNMPAA